MNELDYTKKVKVECISHHSEQVFQSKINGLIGRIQKFQYKIYDIQFSTAKYYEQP